eukprot:TRINITY_DN5400_c0_g1_i1.p1 TRINITY_DN5400_c0_g1~~TRINITY_DN5400_c0_g1_i1.p1  ORF type:complete len:182 (-),score=30.06 TRINITY_DN5400_c0_g1_i1:22-567(-)
MLRSVALFSNVSKTLYKSFPIRRLHIENTLKTKGITLPEPVRPKGSYSGVVQTGKLLFVSGHLPYDFQQTTSSQTLITGKVGKDLTTEEAADAAKFCTLSILSTLHDHLGTLDKIVKIVKVFGIVNCVESFTEQPKVLNGASDFLIEIFGKEKGSHARAAIGSNSLPLNVPVEVEMIVEIH